MKPELRKMKQEFFIKKLAGTNTKILILHKNNNKVYNF